MISFVPKHPDNIYYDLVITNFKSETTEPQKIYFNENRTNPIINNSGDYKLSIVRFSVDTQALPLFIPEIQPNQDDPNLTVYSVSMSYLPEGTSTPIVVQQYIAWIPQNKNEPIPPPPSATGTGLQSDAGKYYYCMSYQYWVGLVYTALQTCFTNLQTAVYNAGYTTALYNDLPPVITWNNDTKCAVLYCPSANFNNYSSYSPLTENPQAVQLYFNSPLFALFSSFPATYFTNSTSLGQNWRIAVGDFTGTNSIYLPSTFTSANSTLYSQVFQEYSTISNWSPVTSVCFLSSTLPIVSNQMSAPLLYNDGRVISIGNNANFAQIITDLETLDNCYKPSLLYVPSGEYRYISMTGTSPISNIDVSVMWRNKLGILQPLYLASGGTCTIKFLFEKVKGK
jgi:hypothetical protein